MFVFGQAGRYGSWKAQELEASQRGRTVEVTDGKVRGSPSYVLLQCVMGHALGCARRDLELPCKPPLLSSLSVTSP